ncbi:MAG: alpha-glucosidase [Anaerolineales bacterium]|nr:alpha-glucosidase [Anaerolineales bacterium]
MSANDWWKRAVFYQIYPRSFADSDGDGIGDLRGIIEKLDYLQWLGIDAIWLSPHFPSPQADCGYDVSDYCDVAPEYGTLDDFRELLAGAHARGMKVVLDLVMNHSSEEHPWFQASRRREAPYSDWYMWHDGAADGGPPNDWESGFGGSAWTWDELRGQYYYHYFLKEQPDLNWDNPEVREAMWNVVRFWYELGVDGFRLDAIGTLFEEPNLTNHGTPYSWTTLMLQMAAPHGPVEEDLIWRQVGELNRFQHDLPAVHPIMKQLRIVNDEFADRVLIGESEDIAYYGNGSDELHLVFNFDLMRTDRLNSEWVAANQAARRRAMPPGTWPCNTLGNHDKSRSFTQYGDGVNDGALARLSIALLATLRGTPVFYNGEEIGMSDYYLTDRGQLRDRWAIVIDELAQRALPLSDEALFERTRRLTRDRCRTPMQWQNAANGGFSPAGVTTWLPVNPNYAEGVNVAEQRADDASLLHFFRDMLHLRRALPALIDGDYTLLHAEADGVLCFARHSAEQRITVCLNFAEAERRLCLPHGDYHVHFSTAQRGSTLDANGLTLAPFEVMLLEAKARE